VNNQLKFQLFFCLFWLFSIITLISTILMAYFTFIDSLQKATTYLGIMAFGMSGAWICLSSCNNLKNELHQKIFETEMKNQLDRIENKYN